MIKHNQTLDQPSTAALRLVRARTLNEIAFIRGDLAHGGPARDEELSALRQKLHELDRRIAEGSNRTQPGLN